MRESKIVESLQPAPAAEPDRFAVLTGLYQIETLPSGEEVRFPLVFCPESHQGCFVADDELRAAVLDGSPVSCPLCEKPHRLIGMAEALDRNLVCHDGDDQILIVVMQEMIANSLRALRLVKSAAA